MFILASPKGGLVQYAIGRSHVIVWDRTGDRILFFNEKGEYIGALQAGASQYQIFQPTDFLGLVEQYANKVQLAFQPCESPNPDCQGQAYRFV